MVRLRKIGNFWPGFTAFVALLMNLVLVSDEVLGQDFVWLAIPLGGMMLFFLIRGAFAANDEASYSRPR